MVCGTYICGNLHTICTVRNACRAAAGTSWAVANKGASAADFPSASTNSPHVAHTSPSPHPLYPYPIPCPSPTAGPRLHMHVYVAFMPHKSCLWVLRAVLLLQACTALRVPYTPASPPNSLTKCKYKYSSYPISPRRTHASRVEPMGRSGSHH